MTLSVHDPRDVDPIVTRRVRRAAVRPAAQEATVSDLGLSLNRHGVRRGGGCLRCLGNTAGKHCEACRPGYYGDSGRGCLPCGCIQSGSVSESCDQDGRCHCTEGVAGDKCDRCSRGYYGYHSRNCTGERCDGQVVQPVRPSLPV
uniref:Laminin EGF-like domain-containing protein n=1 Tax=Poecilia reticulata TaxID=8081 RepID=A0A3P9NZG0_POERE